MEVVKKMSACPVEITANDLTSGAQEVPKQICIDQSRVITHDTITFNLKFAIFTQQVTIQASKLNLGFVKQLAISFVNEIFFQKSYPQETFVGEYVHQHYNTPEKVKQLHECMTLRLCLKDQDCYTPFNSVSEIKPDCYVSIDFSGRQMGALRMSNPSLCSETLKAGDPRAQPANEDLLNVHPTMTKRKSATNLLNLINPFKSMGTSFNSQPTESDQAKDHKSRGKSTSGVLDPIFNQLNRFKDTQQIEKKIDDTSEAEKRSGPNSHHKIYSKLCDAIMGQNGNNHGGNGNSSILNRANGSEIGDKCENKHYRKLDERNSSTVNRGSVRLHRLQPSIKQVKRYDPAKSIIEGWLQHTTNSDESGRSHYWRMDETDLTLYESPTSTRYSKAIRLDMIKRVLSAQSLPKTVRESLVNSQVQSLSSSANSSCLKLQEYKAQMNSIFAFELASGSMFLVQAEDEIVAAKWRGAITSILDRKKGPLFGAVEEIPQSSTATDSTVKDTSDQVDLIDIKFDDEIPQASSTKSVVEAHSDDNITPTEDSGSRQMKGKSFKISMKSPVRMIGDHHNNRLRNKEFGKDRLQNRSRIKIKLNPEKVPDHWILDSYLVEQNRTTGVGFEELGQGQFGKVYAAICHPKNEDDEGALWSGVPVAIKEVSKARFSISQQEKLKNEAEILSRLNHPGIIVLQGFHELSEKVYIVMEQLEDDMLEMIITSEDRRLNERVTRFLIYQILEALKYLHHESIVHCDLKPENVLLVERRSLFPQIKLCDFGFAKIIEKNSFRKSLVGTPAYLAPEVVQGHQYNWSVDLWSVGVITYVSLSGDFPFDDRKSVEEQISRADFMYPDDPWSKLPGAVKFINKLMRLEMHQRLRASAAQMDDWLQDYELWCDLCDLEARVGERWLTDDADFKRWAEFARKHNKTLPASAVRLHEEFAFD